MESTVTHPLASESIHVTENSCFHKKSEALDAQIVEAENLIASVESERFALTSDPNGPNDRFNGTLPFEIASYIFELYFKVQEGAPDLGSVFRLHPVTDAPFRLGAVCRTWRAIAWSSPALWTTLSICLYHTRNNITLDLAKQWLDCTGTLPLSIRFYDPPSFLLPFHNAAEMNYIDGMIRMVNSVCSRWQNLDLQLSADLVHRFGLNESTLQSSILKQVSLDCNGKFYSIGGFLFHDRNHSPTHLRLLNVEVDAKFDPSSWMNLTNFEADYIDFEGCLQVIRAATPLKELILRRVDFPAARSLLFVTHRDLNSLTLIGTPERVANALLDALTLPSLESILILGFNFGTDRTGINKSLYSLVSRSSCHLKVLHPAPCFLPDHDVQIQLLQQTPSLESLQYQYDCERCWEKILQMKLDDSNFLPHLQTFQTRIPYPPGKFAWENILKSLETKQGSPSVTSGRSHSNVLRSLHFHFEHPSYSIHLPTDFLHRFILLMNHGLDISMEYRGEDVIAKSLAFHYPAEDFYSDE